VLPERHEYLEIATVPAMVDAIRRLAVRGAPAIGVAAAFGVLLGVQSEEGDARQVLARASSAADELARARPTAVNLFWALDRMRARAARDEERGLSGEQVVGGLFEEAHAIWEEDRAVCRRLGEVGAELVPDGATVLTHCNAGSLATVDGGTALAPIYRAIQDGKRVAVFADETRPLLQGARLTAWELMQAGVDVTLITDSTAGRVLFEKKIDLVFVGADRIAANGDVCNKIGTYSVAVLARANGVPFYVVAPLSTFDLTVPSGDCIPIEQRPSEEVTHGFGRPTAPAGVKVYSPAFDVTPAELVTAIVTEVGIIERPDRERVAAVLRRGAAPS
jgi:methylthioribose-1-phosphate isomerase